MKLHSLCTSTFKANFDFLLRLTFVAKEFAFTELICAATTNPSTLNDEKLQGRICHRWNWKVKKWNASLPKSSI